MIKTLYFRVVLTFLIAVVIGLLAAITISNTIYRNQMQQDFNKELLSDAKQLVSLIDGFQGTSQNFNVYVNDLVRWKGLTCWIVDAEGTETEYGENLDEVKLTPEKISNIWKKGVWYDEEVKKRPGSNGIGLTFKQKRIEKVLYVTSNDPNRFATLNPIIPLSLGIVLLVGSLCFLVAVRYVVRPLRKIALATKQLAKGKFDVELEIHRKDEIGQLANNFNEMAKELKQIEQSRQDFVSNVSHEFQTPLTSIVGFTKALYNGIIPVEDHKTYFAIIYEEGERLSRLCENLLQLTSLESMHPPYNPEKFALDRQIRDVLIALEPQCTAKQMEISFEAVPTLIVGDPDQLKQVWINIISNSIKFTPKGGSMSVSLYKDTVGVTVSITDTGEGIAEDTLPYIFDRFYMVDSSRNRKQEGGFGLGLSIADKIIKLHHGTIEVKSIIGDGTTFVVRLISEI